VDSDSILSRSSFHGLVCVQVLGEHRALVISIPVMYQHWFGLEFSSLAAGGFQTRTVAITPASIEPAGVDEKGRAFNRWTKSLLGSVGTKSGDDRFGVVERFLTSHVGSPAN
jgi:hypothetical protein